MDIFLNDILHLNQKNVKVRFNIYNNIEDPIDVYLTNKHVVNNQWLFWKNDKTIFRVGDIVICLVRIKGDFWLLTTIKEVTKDLNITNNIGYIGVEISEFKKFFGKLVIQFHKNGQYRIVNYNNFKNRLIVNKLLENVYDGDEFPGYNKVSISYTQLNNIVKNNKTDWINALNNQKAVYLLTDCNNGKLYVGSATSSNGMLLSRWKNYLSTCHGGNVKLKKLVNHKGIDYFKRHFKFSIIENYNETVDDKVILTRESYWKDVLKTRDFGYNEN